MSGKSMRNSAGRESGDQTGKSNDKFMGSCANCGVKENDDIKLKICTACKSIRYCGVECQKKHRPEHKRDCKKRAAELRDKLLFKQPGCCTYKGDCPICFLPLPHDPTKCVANDCCSQMICLGCSCAHFLPERGVAPEQKCIFCRSPVAETPAQELKYRMKRIEVNCPVAIRNEGLECYHDGKYEEAFEYYSKAAELGDIEAHYHLATLYGYGEGVEKDEKKQRKHLETAAIGGHPGARLVLCDLEMNKGNINRTIKHLVIAAKQGSEHAIDFLKKRYTDGDGIVSKDVLADALRGYQEALDTMKSPQREAAEEVKTS